MNLTTYLREIQKELKLTSFPNQNVVINFTAFVIIFTGVMAVYLGALDLGFGDAIIQGINTVRENNGIVATSTISTTTSPVATATLNVTPTSATSVPANILVK
jgi:preprotein translocase SecE subunit